MFITYMSSYLSSNSPKSLWMRIDALLVSSHKLRDIMDFLLLDISTFLIDITDLILRISIFFAIILLPYDMMYILSSFMTFVFMLPYAEIEFILCILWFLLIFTLIVYQMRMTPTAWYSDDKSFPYIWTKQEILRISLILSCYTLIRISYMRYKSFVMLCVAICIQVLLFMLAKIYESKSKYNPKPDNIDKKD